MNLIHLQDNASGKAREEVTAKGEKGWQKVKIYSIRLC